MKKKSNKKALAFGSAAILTGIAAFVYIKRRKQKQKALNQSSSNQQNTVNPVKTNKTVVKSSGFPLQYGSSGENVKRVQEFLNKKFKAGLTVDGKFGDKTRQALKKYAGTQVVTEATFKQYVGTPANSNTTISLNPFTNAAKGWNLALKNWVNK